MFNNEKKIKVGGLGNLVFYFLIVLNLVVVIILLSKTREVEDIGVTSDKAINSILHTTGIQYRSEGLPVFIDELNDSLFLLCLIHEQVLVLRIGDKHCDVCVNEAVLDYNEFVSQSGIKNGIILTSFDNETDFKFFRNRYQNVSVMNIGTINIPVDEMNNPYMFLIDRSMKTDMVFVHQKEFPEKTKGYFEALQARLNR